MGLPERLALLLLLHLSRPTCQQQPGAGAVRLCGRDLVRAVIYTCGGSRWKRISPPGTSGQPPRADFVQISSDKGPEDRNLLPALDLMLDQLRSASQPSGQQSLKDLFNLYDDDTEFVPPPSNFNEYIHQAENAARRRGDETGLANSKGLNYFPWVKHPRRKRDFSMGVAEICCNMGCTQTEISSLC